MVTAEVSDTLLASASFIPASEAWLDQLLSDNSLSYATLAATKQTLAKAAQIARCCWTVLNAAPKESFQAGLTTFSGVNANIQKETLASLKREWTDLLNLCGASTIQVGGAHSGGDDYQPDEVDETNIHWTDSDSEGFSRFA
jgi:hypothetical protein